MSDTVEASMLGLLNTLLRRRLVVFGVPAVLVVITALHSLLFRSRDYVSEAKFAPQVSQSSQSQFAGLAAQFGLSLGAAPTGGVTLDFYGELLHSRELLREAALTRYQLPGVTDSLGKNLMELLEINAETPEEQLRLAVVRLRQTVAVSIGLKTGLITVRTTARWPDLAVQLNRRLLDLLNQFNLQKRQSQAGAERRFIEGRLREAQAELAQVEAGLERFLQQNRSVGSSPALLFQQRRLERRVELQQEVYNSLATAYERSRIDEVRDTPVITVVDPPEKSVDRVGRGTVLRSLVALVFGGVLGVVLALGAQYVEQMRAERPQEFVELTSRLWALLPGRGPRGAA